MKICLCDERLPIACRTALEGEGFITLPLPKAEGVEAAICSHTDIVLFRNGNQLIIPREYADKNRDLFKKVQAACAELNIIKSDIAPIGTYPKNACYNALVIGKLLFVKQDTVCRDILEYATAAGLKAVNVRQGYPACTVLPITDSAAITADKGMEKELLAQGIRVLLVRDSERILLPPYKNGFIGGCAARLGDAIYFMGNLECHPDAERIKDFIRENGMRAISLTGGEYLYDVGGAVLCDSDTLPENSTPTAGSSTSPTIPATE